MAEITSDHVTIVNWTIENAIVRTNEKGSFIGVSVNDDSKDKFLAELVDVYNAVKGDKEGIEDD